jgi:hypothetical protein
MAFHPSLQTRRRLASGIVLLVCILVATVSFAQEPYPKFDIFTGYQYINPGGNTPNPNFPPDAPVAQPLPSLNKGGVANFTYNFTRIVGLSAEYGDSFGGKTDPLFTNEGVLSLGPRFMYRFDGGDFFNEDMVSWNRLTGPYNLGSNNGIGAIVGGGMDVNAWKHLSIRPVEADYIWSRHNYSNFVDSSFPSLRRTSLNGLRLASGLDWKFGYPPTTPPAAACSVQPTEVMQGEPVTATANASNFNPKHTLTYNWTGTGGKVNGNGNTASIDTTGLAGGSYTVTANVADAKEKKLAPATCNATFTVKEPPKNPPTMSCSASPSSVQTGATVNVTCTCTSPDNASVSIANYTTTAGTISGSGNSATLNTAGAPSGTITVGATCTDSRGLTNQASTGVTVENPPPPPPPASKLSDCDFTNMSSKKVNKPWRVDNECKGKLDDVAKNLQQNADNKLVIVGNSGPDEKRPNLAAERAVNAKAYLTSGEAKLGIDPSRISCRTGSAGTPTDEFWIVPAGSTFPSDGTQPVDENAVQPVPDHPKPGAKKKKAAPAAQ